MKKGQITGILLIVVLLAIILGATYYLSVSITRKSIEKETSELFLSQSRTEPMREYVTSCLALTARESLEKLGSQGGFLYKHQGGPFDSPQPPWIGINFIPYGENDMLFGILKPEGDTGPFSYTLPEYPWETFPELGSNRSLYVGFYGYQVLPVLLKPTKNQNSIQEQLEMYVSANLPKCLDWTQFEKQNLEMSEGAPNVTVTFTEHETIFNAQYAIQVKDKMSGARASLNQFSSMYSIDLLELYGFIEQVTEKDASDISYNLDAVRHKRFHSKRDKNTYEHDDVVSFTDTESYILDKPYEFRVAIQNRPPALERLDNREHKGEINAFEICGAYNQENRYLAPVMSFDSLNNTFSIRNPRPQCSDPIRIPITAWDPDEDLPKIIFELGGIEVRIPYEIPEKYIGNPLKIKIKASDGEYTDWQVLTFKTYFVGAK